MRLSLWQLKKLVNQKSSLINILKKANPEGYYRLNQICFCPFHLNENTPSANIYEDRDGIQRLYCFFEQRQYASSDALELLLNTNVYEFGKAIWDNMSDIEQNTWLINNTEVGNSQVSFSKKEIKDNKNLEFFKTEFKYRKISFKELLNKYIEEN